MINPHFIQRRGR